MPITETQLRWFRLRRSGLVKPFALPEAVARALAGVQAQILPAAGLALWNRTVGLTEAAFNALIFESRTLVKLWGQRGALHLYAGDDWPLICGALSEQQTWWRRQTAQAGQQDEYEAIVAGVAALLRERGTMSRSDLRAAFPDLAERHFSSWGGIFAELVHRGIACHAEREGSQGRFAHREHWLPTLDWSPPAFEDANVELARRYLRAYGPATEPDFRYWRNAKAADSRRWLAALGDETAAIDVAGIEMHALREDWDDLTAAPPEREAWPVRMLYRFDPLMLSTKDKAWLVDVPYYKQVWRPGGHIEGTLLEHGRIAGAWRYDRKNGGLSVTVFPFAPLPEHVQAAVETQASQIAAFFGLALTDLSIERRPG